MTSKAFANATDANRQQGGRRNLIINGAMQVAQRGTSQTSTGIGSIDRYLVSTSNLDDLAFTVSQDSNAPDGFAKSLKFEVTTAESSLDANEQVSIRYNIEAQDLQMLDFNTSNAKQTTLSFFVKSSDAATYSVFIYAPDSGRLITENYTINTANTWEYKTITFSGDTSGVINDDNGLGFQFGFGLGAGSDLKGGSTGSWATYSVSNEQEGNTSTIPTTLNATWQITGVQLEVGTTATPFEHRSYGEELALCQRYYQLVDRGSGIVVSSTNAYINIPYIKTMRASPSFGTTGGLAINDVGVNATQSTGDITAYNPNTSGSFTEMRNFSGLTQYRPALMRGNAGTFVTLDAEL